MRNIKFFEEFESSDFSNQTPEEIHEGHEGHEGHEMENYMFFQNLHTLKRSIEELLELDPSQVDQILSDGHGWALDHVATSVDDVEEVYHFLANSIEMGHIEPGHEMPMHGHEEDHDDDDDDDDDDESQIQVSIKGSDDSGEMGSEEKEEE